MAPCSLADTHQHFRLPTTSIIRVMEAAGRSVVSCRRFGTTVCGCEILIAVLVMLQVIWDFSPCRLIYLHLQGQQSKMKSLRSTETSVILHQSTGRAVLLCLTRLLRIIATFTETPYCSTFYSVHRYIKTPVNTNKCTILQSMYSLYYM